jgi:hypothetical protein
MEELTPIQRRLRYAAICIFLALLVEAACLIWARPLAFVALVTVGGLLAIVGIGTYLLSLVSHEAHGH